jgi:hypothetical protein
MDSEKLKALLLSEWSRGYKEGVRDGIQGYLVAVNIDRDRIQREESPVQGER